MKPILLLLLLFGVYLTYSQPQKPVFLRVYDSSNHKIGKGTFFSVSDTLLTITGAGEPAYFLPDQVGFIKTKHSAGHKIGVTVIIWAAVGAILGAITAPSGDTFIHYSAGEGAAGGALIGIPVGGLLGGLSLLLRRQPHVYPIHADAGKWKLFKTAMDKR